MDLNQVYRSLVLSVADRSMIERLVTTRGWGFASRFVAGTAREDALKAVQGLESEGVHGILDLLGEMVASEEEARGCTRQIGELVDAFGQLPYPRYVSVKPSQLGLDLGPETIRQNLRAILDRARTADCFIRIDIEDSPRVDATLALYRDLLEEGYENLGLVLQSYLRRTRSDLESLLPLQPNLRFVKGAYKEPAEVAFQDKRTVDEDYVFLCQRNLEAGNPTAIATHDERIIRRMKTWIDERGIDRELYEYQMLYGIRRDLQRDLAREGFRVRAYVPFGTEWYPYFSRRIAERPANALFVLKALLKG